MDNKEKKKGAGVQTALVVIGCIAAAVVVGCIIYSGISNKGGGSEFVPEEQGTEITTNEETEGTETVTEEPVTEEIIVGLSDTVLTDDMKAELENINEKILNYISSNSKKTSFITEYGFLYDDTAKNNVTVKDLVKNGYVDASEDIVEYTDIIYVCASDVAKYAENIDANDTKLQVFTAYNSKDGYFVSNDFYSEGAMLEKSEYEELILSYSFAHGEVHTPKRGESEFENIMSAIGFGEDFDVKHLACDNNYACAVLGSLSDTRIVKEYVLTKQDGQWKVAIDKLEESEDPRKEVNMKFPKMELGLLPKYVIAQHGELQNGFSKYETALVQLGMVKKDELPATYDCGADGFTYMEFGDTKLLGRVNDEHKMEFVPVDSTEEAIANMLAYNDDPPVYIINFHN